MSHITLKLLRLVHTESAAHMRARIKKEKRAEYAYQILTAVIQRV